MHLTPIKKEKKKKRNTFDPIKNVFSDIVRLYNLCCNILPQEIIALAVKSFGFHSMPLLNHWRQLASERFLQMEQNIVSWNYLYNSTERAWGYSICWILFALQGKTSTTNISRFQHYKTKLFFQNKLSYSHASLSPPTFLHKYNPQPYEWEQIHVK